MDQCGCNNNLYNKWCLTQWSKNVVSNIYKTSLQRMPMVLPRYSLPTNLIPSAYFHFKPKSKKLLGQACLTTGKKSFTVFWVSWSEKGQSINFFICPPAGPPFFTNCKWCKPNNFVMVVLVIVLWINPLIIILWNICMQSNFRPPIVKMLVLVIFYCQNLMQGAVIISYWLKMFTLRNTTKKHLILGRTLGI